MSVPPTMIWPLEGRSIPAMRFNSVDLPEPDGPIKQRNSPASIFKLVSLRATISAAPFLNIFDTFLISTALIMLPTYLTGCRTVAALYERRFFGGHGPPLQFGPTSL